MLGTTERYWRAGFLWEAAVCEVASRREQMGCRVQDGGGKASPGKRDGKEWVNSICTPSSEGFKSFTVFSLYVWKIPTKTK